MVARRGPQLNIGDSVGCMPSVRWARGGTCWTNSRWTATSMSATSTGIW